MLHAMQESYTRKLPRLSVSLPTDRTDRRKRATRSQVVIRPRPVLDCDSLP